MKKIGFFICCGSLLILWNCASFKPKPIFNSGKETTIETEETDIATEIYRNNDTNINREKLMGEIENLLGVPYRLGGTTPKGMDCSGFVNFVFENSFNKTLPRRVSELYLTGVYVSKNNLRFFDLIFFKNIKSPDASHVGIYLDADQFAHASQSQGVMISSLKEPYYNKRFAGARRVIE